MTHLTPITDAELDAYENGRYEDRYVINRLITEVRRGREVLEKAFIAPLHLMEPGRWHYFSTYIKTDGQKIVDCSYVQMEKAVLSIPTKPYRKKEKSNE